MIPPPFANLDEVKGTHVMKPLTRKEQYDHQHKNNAFSYLVRSTFRLPIVHFESPTTFNIGQCSCHENQWVLLSQGIVIHHIIDTL
jgi:hypothetical protein